VTAYDSKQAPSPYQPPHKDSGRTFAWGIGRAIVWLVYAFALFATVIAALAFVLQLFGANPNNGFAQWVYRSASRVTAPFRGIFPAHVNGNSVLDVSLLFAIIMYALFALLVHSLIDYIDRRRYESVGRDRYEEQRRI
jgi:YggT family protein